MSETRVIVCVDNNTEMVIAMTDCCNKQLQQICGVVQTDNENGIGKSYEKVCRELYPDCFFRNLISTEDDCSLNFAIRDIKTVEVAECKDISISVVDSGIDYEDEPGEDPYAYLDRLWKKLEDVPFEENKNGDLSLAVDWFAFAKGTEPEEIKKFFDMQHPDGIGHFANN